MSLSFADGEPNLKLHLLVADQGRDTHSALEEVRAAAEKPDKMEETLTCIICQDLLHDCVRCAHVGAGPRRKQALGRIWGRVHGNKLKTWPQWPRLQTNVAVALADMVMST